MPARSTTPDLFSAVSGAACSGSATKPGSSPGAAAQVSTLSSRSRHVLPNDLPNAIGRLEDHEFDRLLSAALAEQKRRGKTAPESNAIPGKKAGQGSRIPLTVGKVNAIRAAFKAGISPSRIARQFGVSQSDIRKALATGAVNR
jgi:hypothetical protein